MLDIPNKNNLSQNILYILGSLLLIASPWILLLITIYASDGNISSSRPFLFDEYQYWHEILSFSEKGLNFGYYTFNDMLPEVSSFGPHGFGTISAYIPYATLFGWNFNSLVIANNLYLSFAFILLTVLIKPQMKKLVLIILFSITYIPLILFIPTSMSEILNYASLIIYFALLYLLYKSEKHRNLIFTFLLIFCIYICCIRVIYIILILPIFMVKWEIESPNAKFLKALTIWIIMSAIIFFVVSAFTAPYPFSYMVELFESPTIGDFIFSILGHIGLNIKRFFSFKYDTPLQVIQRYFVFIIMIVLSLKSGLIRSKFKNWNFIYFVSLTILLLAFIITVAAYDVFDWRDYRVLAPLAFGIILFITLADNISLIRYATGVNVIILIAVFLFFPNSFRTSHFALTSDRYAKVETVPELQAIEYTPDAKSKFENTIVIDGFRQELMLSIPAGIGITYYLDASPENLKSKYLYSLNDYSFSNYKIVSETENGKLYERIEYK